MMNVLRSLTVCVSVSLVLSLSDSTRGQPTDNVNQPESRPRPTPKWVEMFDQGETDPRLKGIQTPRGVKVEIVAQAPAVVHPQQIAFGDDGTLHVLEWKPAANTRIEVEEAEREDGTRVKFHRTWKDTKDELKTLHDRDGDGLYDEARVVMNDLELPSGLLIYEGWIYWTSGGRILRRRPHEPELLRRMQAAAEAKQGPPTKVTADGKWIEQQLVRGLTGVHPFQASGLVIGPDGWLYVSAGSGDNRAEGWDGSRATVLRSGAIFRMRPDGSQVHEFARGFINPRSNLAFDAVGNPFHADDDVASGKFAGVRLIHILEGGDYGWRHVPGTAARAFDDHAASQADPARASASGERPGTLPGMFKTGPGTPAGLLIYGGTCFPEFFQGLLIYPDADRQLVRAYVVERDGATFQVTSQLELMKSDDPLFRPCQAIQGPDSAIYIADWQSDGPIADRLWGDGKEGRIYRLSWGGTKEFPAIPLAPRDTWSKIASATDDERWALLERPDIEVRRRASQQLVTRALRNEAARANIRERTLSVLKDVKKPQASRATVLAAACQWTDKSVRAAMYRLLEDQNTELVRLVADAIGNVPPAEREELDAAAQDVEGVLAKTTNPAVDRTLRLALAKLGACGVEDAAEWGFEATSVNFGPKLNRYIFDAHVRALEIVSGAAKELMLGNLDVALNMPEVEPQERQRIKEFVVATAEAMRTRELAIFLDALLHGDDDFLAKMEAPLEARLIAAYQNVQVEPPINANAVVEWLDKHPGGPVEVEIAALETISLVGTTKPDAATKLADRLLAQPQSAVLVAGSLVASRLDRALLPRIRDALGRHAAKDQSQEIAMLLAELEKFSP